MTELVNITHVHFKLAAAIVVVVTLGVLIWRTVRRRRSGNRPRRENGGVDPGR